MWSRETERGASARVCTAFATTLPDRPSRSTPSITAAMLIKTTMKRPRPRKTKALRTQLKQASLRDADLTREVMDDWAAVERDEMEEHIDRIAPMPEELKAMQATAKRTGANSRNRCLSKAEAARYTFTSSRERRPRSIQAQGPR